MDPFLGEIRMCGFNYAPEGWALCNGQLLSIAANTALFSLLGTTFGGNGITNFALPDLRGRAPLHYGQGPGLTNRDMGEVGGEENVTLTIQEMPAHSHLVVPVGSSNEASNPDPTNGADANNGTPAYVDASTANVKMAPASCEAAGGSLPHDNMQPYLVVNFIIALNGIFPPRG
jgi:microcystin-dependent protein